MLTIAGGIILAVLLLPLIGLLLYVAFWLLAAPIFAIAFLIRWFSR